MREYVITTDNNADLPESFYKEHGIGCAYFSYTMDNKIYTHENFLSSRELYHKMKEGTFPTTTQINPAGFRSFFEPYLKDGKDILHICFSSGLSGTYNSCCIAAEELREEYPERKIRIVDSLSASLGQGMLVHYVQKQKEDGKDLETVAEWAEAHKTHIVHLFTVDDLEHLYRGGRVSRTAAVLGGMLNIKPVLHVDNEGKLIPLEKVRGRKKSMLELVSLMDKKIGSYRESCDTVFISHGDCLEDAEFLSAKVKERYAVKTEIINEIGPVIGAHSGQGTLAVFFLGDER